MSLFWKVTRYARAARFWLLLALAALAWFGFGGEAKAQVGSCPDYAAGCTVQQAKAACDAWIAAGPYSGNRPVPHACTDASSGGSSGYWRGRYCYNDTTSQCTNHNAYFTSGCPAGTAWDAENNRCGCPAGSTFYGGECKACSSLNSESGFAGVGERVKPFSSKCVAGCKFGAAGPRVCTTLGGETTCSGQFEFTGAACTVNVAEGDISEVDTVKPQKPQECIGAGAGQTYCQKPNGDQCYTASTGRQICWKPGQVGEKGDGPIAQVRKPGTETPQPSSMQTAAGDPLVSDGTPVTATTVVNGQTTITTTTQNFRTQFGTDAKPENSGQAADGSGDDEQDGTASGGTDCDSRPVVSDPALEMVASQAWATRCAVEAGNAAEVTGDVGDCKTPFTVDGTNANAQQLRAMRAQICGVEAREDAARGEAEGISAGLDADIAGMESETAGQSIFADPGEGQGLSSTRFGAGGGCPQFNIPTPIGTFNQPPMFCSIVAGLRVLFMLIATVWGLMRIREA